MSCSASKLVLPTLPLNSQFATKHLVEFIVDSLWPATTVLKNQLICLLNSKMEARDELVALKDVFSLCCSQINKCILLLLQIFQTEYRNHISMQDSRECTLDRLFWCLDRLKLVEENLEKLLVCSDEMSKTHNEKTREVSLNSSILATPMYFVNWVDQSLELLGSLSEIVYKTEHKECKESLDAWHDEIIGSVSSIHTTIDELLLSGMTLCRHCLPADQTALTARCQVVLRETKKLISEIISGDIDKTYQVTKESLKLPLRPTNINVHIDVLKDSLYVLEANTNTALLALLVECFSKPTSPLKELEKHFSEGAKEKCPCKDVEGVDDCIVVKQFDFFNERLMQIGGFSVSCSSDQNRILSLKSGLASLEALDPHLVPAVMLAPDSHHASLLTNVWTREVQQIRNTIFLIVAPVAFIEKSKDAMNKKLILLIRANKYIRQDVCDIIQIGDLVLDFFNTYNAQEPEALVQKDQLDPLIADLLKVLKECKTVSNLHLQSADSTNKTQDKPGKHVTIDQIVKRLKLLFTLVNRINSIFQCDEEDKSEDCVLDDDVRENTKINTNTQIIRKENNILKSFATPRASFGREKSFAKENLPRCIISKMTKHFTGKSTHKELSFSVQLDELFNDISQYVERTGNDRVNNKTYNKNSGKINNTSILYNCKRDSLRKTMMKNKFSNVKDEYTLGSKEQAGNNCTEEQEWDAGKSIMDSTTHLQITEILDQLSNLSKMFDVETQESGNKTLVKINNNPRIILPEHGNILTLSINNQAESAKKVWNIPVRQDSAEDNVTPESSISSSMQSNVTTLDRLNDINLLENRLNELKTSNA